MEKESLFAIHDPVGVKLLSILRLKFTHLNGHKFRHDFRDDRALCMIVAINLKQQNTSSCVAFFIEQTKTPK